MNFGNIVILNISLNCDTNIPAQQNTELFALLSTKPKNMVYCIAQTPQGINVLCELNTNGQFICCNYNTNIPTNYTLYAQCIYIRS